MTGDRQDFLARRSTIRALWIILWVLCLLTLVPEFFITRHPHFSQDYRFGFYAFLGFAACAVMILLAKGLGWLLKRQEDYYD